jgi:hypothetical protein
MLHGFQDFGTLTCVSRFDVEIGPDFLDMGRAYTCVVVSAQYFRCVGATNAFCYVFWDATGDPAKKYKVAQSLCAFQQGEHAGPVLGCTGIILNKGPSEALGEYIRFKVSLDI